MSGVSRQRGKSSVSSGTIYKAWRGKVIWARGTVWDPGSLWEREQGLSGATALSPAPTSPLAARPTGLVDIGGVA